MYREVNLERIGCTMRDRDRSLVPLLLLNVKTILLCLNHIIEPRLSLNPHAMLKPHPAGQNIFETGELRKSSYRGGHGRIMSGGASGYKSEARYPVAPVAVQISAGPAPGSVVSTTVTYNKITRTLKGYIDIPTLRNLPYLSKVVYNTATRNHTITL